MNDVSQASLQQFLDTIAPWEKAYTCPTLSFLAARREGVLLLLHGRLFLQTDLGNVPRKIVESRSIVAGNISLSELGITHREFLDRVFTSQELPTHFGKLKFPLDSNGVPSVHYVPFHQEGISSGSRLPVLTLSGIQRHGLIRLPELDWELAAGATPYESLGELLFEFSLGGYQGDFALVEVAAHTVALVDFNSKVVGETAEPAMLLASSADTKEARLSYRVLLHGKVIERGSLAGIELKWTPQDGRLRGVGKVRIPSGAALQCFAIYAGHAHHKGWIADPTLSQNPRRAAFEEFDPNQAVLRDFLFEAQRTRNAARDFEVGIAWLLWMLGFSVAHAGATPRTSEAADIMATTPLGHTAIVECTTGHLKSEFKLSKLVERVQTIRRRLDESGNSHLRVLPVIVTALSKEEVRADLDQARTLGVVVATREDLLSALDQTIMLRNAEDLFARAEASIRPKQTDLGFSPIDSRTS